MTLHANAHHLAMQDEIAAFSLRGAGFQLGEKVLLHPLGLDLPTGRFIALVGHNGSGKSTLLKLLARQQAPTEGEIRFMGQPAKTWSARSLARRLAYMPQNTPPAAGMLVKELVALGRYPWHGALGRFGAQDQAKVDEAIERTGIAPFADRLVDTLSGGERQRAWLAMMIAQDADCFLLDEPTSALDVNHQIEVLSLVRDLVRDKGITVIAVLHDINMAARFCDMIVALHSGQLIARATPEEIMTPDELFRIYNVQMDVIYRPTTGHHAALLR